MLEVQPHGTAAGHAHGRARRFAAWLYVAPAIGIAAWGGNHFTPLLQLYRRDEGFSALQVDLLLAFYIVGLIPAFVISGPLSDRYGRKPLMLIAVLAGVAGSAILGLDPRDLIVLCVGRLISGISVAIAMTVGTTWVKELSDHPWEPRPRIGVGARRASLTLTAGLGIGAGVSGTLAQWGPLPTLIPYLFQILLSIGAAIILLRAPETSPHDSRSLLDDLRIPRHARRRFLLTVVPLAPWVFAAAALAYAVTPALVGNRVGDDTIAFATLLTVLTLAAGAAVQPFTHHIARLTRGHNALLGLSIVFVGIVLCAVDAATKSVALAIVVAVVLGIGYGICLVAGLVVIQDLIRPHDLGSLTGLFYSLTYLGFALPAVLAALSSTLSCVALISAVGALCAACIVVVAISHRAGQRPTRP